MTFPFEISIFCASGSDAGRGVISHFLRLFPFYEKGFEMKSAQRLVIVSAIFLLASCSAIPPQSPLGIIMPLSTGKAKLTAIQTPGDVHDNLPYDVILDFRSDGPVNIKRVCFKWLSREHLFSTSSANCFMGNGEVGNAGGNFCSQTQIGTITPDSNLFCVGTSHIRVQSPGKLIVTIRPKNLRADYNTLEAQVEYVYKGKPHKTNIVQTPVIIDK